jgi:hypothetical protein
LRKKFVPIDVTAKVSIFTPFIHKAAIQWTNSYFAMHWVLSVSFDCKSIQNTF